MPYDTDNCTPGRSKEIDAVAHGAMKDMQGNSKGFKTNAADPVNDHVNTVQGNPDDPAYNPGRKLGG